MGGRLGRPVTIDCEGCRLFGTLHEPDPGSPLRDGVILVNAGPTDRSGPHRLYVKLARLLAARGYPVLRLDGRGAGESEGDWEAGFEGKPIQEVFGRIQNGAWVPDATRAVEFMLGQGRVRRVVLGGLCGGALTSVLTAARHPAAAGVFMLGTPVTPSAASGMIERLPEAILKRDARRYVRKLLSPSAWLRFLSFRTDYRVLVGVIRSQVRGAARRLGLPTTGAASERLNPAFAESVRRAIRRRLPLLFVYAENDYLRHEFEECFLPVFGPSLPPTISQVAIEGANHNLTEETWQASLYDALLPWLERAGLERVVG